MTGSVTKRIRSPLIDWALKLARGAGGPAEGRNDIHRKPADGHAFIMEVLPRERYLRHMPATPT